MMTEADGVVVDVATGESLPPGPVGAAARRLAAVGLAVVAVTIATRFIEADSAILNAVRIVCAALTVMCVPGVLLLLLARLEALTLLEIAGLGTALSVGITTLVTVFCMSLHVSFWWGGLGLVAGSVVLGGLALRRSGAGALTAVTVPASEWWLLGGMVTIAVLLFLRGSPLAPSEDQVHLAVVRRLAALAQPSVSTIYMTPDLVYTYPFPSTHALFALTSLVGGVDPLLVYHKLRFMWGFVALLCVYLAAKQLFGDIRLASICGWTGVVLVANGVFGQVAPYMWAQLAPFSHATDVAMGVLLPLMLVSTFQYLGAQTPRDRRMFLAATLFLVLTLTTGKIREIVQFIVYLTSFMTASLVFGPRRPWAARAAVLLVPTLVIVGAYAVYHRLTVTEVGAIVDVNRARILELWSQMTLRDHFVRPLNDGTIVNNFNLLFRSVYPLVLLGAPIVFAGFLRRRLLLFVWASIFAYVLIIRIPVVSFAYLLATYYDMLSGPVRNLMFFIYLLTGASIYMAARALSAVRPLALGLVVAGGLGYFLPRGLDWLRELVTNQVDVLFGGLIVGLLAAWWVSTTRWGQRFDDRTRAFHRPVALAACAGVLIASIAVSLHVPVSALTVWKTPILGQYQAAMLTAAAPASAVEYVVGATGAKLNAKATNDVPTPQLVRWIKDHIPAETVVAANLLNATPLSTFIPQQVPAWPLAFWDPVNYCIAFKRYCVMADASVEKYGVQPFFNDREDRDERRAFLKGFHITYVVVDPATADLMTPVLDRQPELFTQEYSEQRWSVWRVHEAAPPARTNIGSTK